MVLPLVVSSLLRVLLTFSFFLSARLLPITNMVATLFLLPHAIVSYYNDYCLLYV